MTTYTVSSADVLICDINTTLSGTTLTLSGTPLVYNFSPGATVTRASRKTTFVIQKPGAPVGFEIGMGERQITVDTILKGSTATYASGIFHSLTDLRSLVYNQYLVNCTVGGTTRASRGIINLYYSADGISTALIPVIFSSLSVSQASGEGSLFNVRCSFSEVEMP
jgi:hypothetical protein